MLMCSEVDVRVTESIATSDEYSVSYPSIHKRLIVVGKGSFTQRGMCTESIHDCKLHE